MKYTQVVNYEMPFVCPVCFGLGRIRRDDTEQDCRACNGRGIVWSPASITIRPAGPEVEDKTWRSS